MKTSKYDEMCLEYDFLSKSGGFPADSEKRDSCIAGTVIRQNFHAFSSPPFCNPKFCLFPTVFSHRTHRASFRPLNRTLQPQTTVFSPKISTSSIRVRRSKKSSEFLLDEKGSQMRELPSAGDTEDGELNQGPAHDARVGRFGLVSEFGFSFLIL